MELVSVLDALREPVVFVDEEGVVVSANTAAHALFGDGTPLIGRAATELVPDGLPSATERLREPFRCSLSPPSDSSARQSELVIAPRPSSAIHQRSDASDGRRRMGDRAELEHLNSVTDAFRRELQSAITLLRGFSDLLNEGPLSRELDPLAARYISRVHAAGVRTAELSARFDVYVALARDGSSTESVSLTEAARAAYRRLAPTQQSHPGSLTVESLPVLDVQRRKLVMVFEELIDNSLKFARDVGPNIRIFSEKVGAGWKIIVEDDGTGLEPSAHERVFRPFERLHPRRDYPGVGMGLAIVKRVMADHGGRAWSEPRAPNGLRICLEFPAT